MRRNKRVKIGTLPKADPVVKKYVVPVGIPVEIPQYQPAEITNEPAKKQKELPR